MNILWGLYIWLKFWLFIIDIIWVITQTTKHFNISTILKSSKTKPSSKTQISMSLKNTVANAWKSTRKIRRKRKKGILKRSSSSRNWRKRMTMTTEFALSLKNKPQKILTRSQPWTQAHNMNGNNKEVISKILRISLKTIQGQWKEVHWQLLGSNRGKKCRPD